MKNKYQNYNFFRCYLSIKSIGLLLLLLGTATFLNGQTIASKIQSAQAENASFQEIELFSISENRNAVDIAEEFVNYSILDISTSAARNMEEQPLEFMTVLIPSEGNRQSMTLELMKVDVLAEDAQIIEMPANTISPRSNMLHYQGIINGLPNSMVALSIVDEEVYGLASFGNSEENYVFTKLDNSDRHIIYNDKDITHLNEFICSSDDLDNQDVQYTEEELFNGSTKNIAQAGSIGVFFDITNDIRIDKGSSENASNYIEALFNQVKILYANENINIAISGMNVWTTNEPFDFNLQSYKNYRNNNNFPGQLAHLVTYDFNGGIAYVDSLCSPNFAYGVNGVQRSFNNVPTFSFSTYLLAHEMGHNFGSNHTHTCSWNGNNTAIDGCGTPEGNCPNPGIPSEGGTIMSYCHLRPVGIDFNLGFGTQPGNLIRNRFNNASCIEDDTNQAPSVSFTSPTNNITLEEGYDDFVVVALPEDSDGTISTTSLFINDQFIRNENLAPYEWGNGNNVDETLNLGVGTHTFRVVATDNDGATSEDTFTLTVTAPNVVPTVTITTPSSDAITLEEGYDTLVVVADPSDSDGTIAEVALFIDGTFIRNEGVAPYEWGLGNNVTENLGLSVGVHTFRVVATDDEGATAEDTFELTVTASEGNDTTGEIEVSGELRKWHNVALTFTGPNTSETANNNPFLNYRLDVTFTHSSGSPSYVVPGYYAADGDAAQTSATSGNKWRVHFAPDEIGTWNYEVSFRQGNNVAVSNNSSAGSSAGFMDGATGSLEIAVSDKTGRDFRGKGRLQYVGEHYLKFAETGDYFIKQGPDSPENLFAYDDFDNTPNIGNRRKDFAPHLNDWQSGDPTWQNNKGRGLIGAINYIASEGLNSMSFLTMNIEGDDENVFPYIDSDDRLQMDVSKLGQWAIAVEYMQENGIFAHFKTQETENETLLDNGDLGRERRLYYRELIARFGYNLALNWNLGEENGTHGDINQTTEQRIAMTNYFWDNDPYRHLIVIHNGSNDDPDDLLGNVSDLTGFSLQTNQSDFRRVFGRVKEWVDRSRDAGKKWAVACDEPGNAQDAIRPDNDAADSHVDGRKNALWGTLLAGGWGNEWYFGYQHDHSDLSLQDFRSRDLWWDYNRYAIEFFDQVDLPLIEMLNDNSLLSNDNDYCYAKEGEAYVVYLKNGGTNTLDLTDYPGEYSIQWYDPRNGGQLVDGSVTSISGEGNRSLGTAPNSGNQDWVLYIVRTSDPLPNEAPTVNFTTPAGDLTVQEGYTSLELTAEALDSDGTIASVGLFIDDVFVRNENIAPYDFGQGNQVAETLGLTAGNYTFKVIATDNDGATAEDTFTLTVVATLDNEIPTVMFSDPSQDLTVQEGYTSLPLEASASDADGTIANVGLYIDGQFIRNDFDAPYTWGSGANQDETLGLAPGVYTLRVLAIDNEGATAEDTILLTVTALPNEAPTVEFTNPTGDLTLEEGYVSLTLTAQALDSDGTIESVGLYIDGAFVRNENVAPYDFGQGNNVAETLGLTVGSYAFTVIATDDEGATAEDTFTLTVTAVAENQAPGVAFTTPFEETLTVEEGYDSLELVAEAFDDDGSIVSVGLYIDGVFIRNDFESQFNWGIGDNAAETLGLTAGTYTFTVIATDNEGATAEDTFILTVEGVLSIDSNSLGQNVSMYPNPSNNQFFITGLSQERGDLRIIDMLGRVVLVTKIINETQSVNISNLSDGMYLVQIILEDSTLSKRLIKKATVND